MRIAALYDVHGNLPALDAVLRELAREGVDRVVVGGDVLPGPMPAETLDRLLGLDVPTSFIRGNGDADVLAVHRGRRPARVPDAVLPWLSWTAERLRPEHVEAVSAWPATVELPVTGLGKVLFCHATPRSDDELFTRLTPEARIGPAFQGVRGGVVVCGHTHMPFERTIAGLRVVNAGSVGMPFGAPGAWWLRLGPGVERRRTAYDLADAEARIAATGFPGSADMRLREPPAEEEIIQLFEAAGEG